MTLKDVPFLNACVAISRHLQEALFADRFVSETNILERSAVLVMEETPSLAETKAATSLGCLICLGLSADNFLRGISRLSQRQPVIGIALALLGHEFYQLAYNASVKMYMMRGIRSSFQNRMISVFEGTYFQKAVFLFSHELI
jgi:hypothetical protein